MISSELLLSSAERYAISIALSANVSGQKTVRQSRLNIGKKKVRNPKTLCLVHS